VIITLHWDIKKFMKGMSASEKGSKMARLHVLVYLMACANQRCRCWPSIPRMADETGISASTINEAKEWLIEHKALAIVPFEKREGKERAISHRQNVYQLTGVVEIEGKLWSYMLMNDEIKAAIEEELKDLNFDVNVNSERLESNRSNSAKEVSTSSSQGDTNKNLSASQNDADAAPKKTSSPRQSKDNPIFDLIAEKSFNVPKGTKNHPAMSRVAKISHWLQNTGKVTGLSPIEHAATLEQVTAFYQWYAGKYKVQAPKDAVKFAEHWCEYLLGDAGQYRTERLFT
jgi:hypothetical protein